MTGPRLLTNVAVVIARLGAPAVADIRSVLRDWTAAGLVRAPIWVDIDQEANPRLPVQGWESDLVAAAGEVPINVNGWFTARGVQASGAGVRLICLQPLGAAADALTIGPVSTLRERMGFPALQVLNVLAPSPGLTGLPDEAIFDSQRNVLLQPVDTEDPAGKGFAVLPGSPAAMHTAAALATVAGLWLAVGDAPNDADHPWAGRQVQVARTYLRFLDGSEVLDGIAEAVLGENHGVPFSRNPQGHPMPAVNPDARIPTVEQAARQLVASQPVASYTPLPPPPMPRKKQVSPMSAIRDFLSFLGGALLRAPGEWVSRKVDGFQSGVSSKLTAALYGQDGAYEVVMGNRAGQPPSAASAAEGAQWLVSRLSPGSEQPSPDAHALWRGEVSAAVSLLDGSVTSAAEMPARGAQRLIIGDPAAVAPARDTAPFRVPAGLLRSQAPLAIPPNDPYAARRVLEDLTVAQRNAGNFGGGGNFTPQNSAWGAGVAFGSGPVGQGAQAGMVAGELRQWAQQRRSFTWAVSDQIASGLLAAQADQASLLGAATAQELAEAKAAAQTEAGKTKKRMLGWLFGFLLALVVVVVLALIKAIGGLVVIILCVVLVLGWIIGSLITFIRSSQRYYQLLHAMDVLAARRAWADDNSLVVPQAIIRLADVYRRSAQWADVIADLVHDPFCRDSRSAERAAGPIRLSGTLPYSMALGHLPYDIESYRMETFRAAAITLQPGWLDTTELHRRELALSIRSRQSGVREHEMVFNSDGLSGSGLAEMASALAAPAFRATNSSGAVSWLNAKLQAAGFDLKQAQIDAGGSLREVHASEFVQQLVDAEPVPHQEGMSAAGVNSGAADVATTHLWGTARGSAWGSGAVGSGGSNGPIRAIVVHPTAPPAGRKLLDRMVVRCDMTRGLSAGELSYFATSSITHDEEQSADTDADAGTPIEPAPNTFRSRA